MFAVAVISAGAFCFWRYPNNSVAPANLLEAPELTKAMAVRSAAFIPLKLNSKATSVPITADKVAWKRTLATFQVAKKALFLKKSKEKIMAKIQLGSKATITPIAVPFRTLCKNDLGVSDAVVFSFVIKNSFIFEK